MARKARATVAEAAALAREALFASAARTDGGKDDRLGDVILYDLTPGWRAPIASVQDTFRANGLDPKHVLPNAPDWVVAFGRAVDQVGAKVRGEDVKFMDAAPGPNGERRVGIVQVRRNGVVATDDFGTVVCPAAGTEAQRAKGTHGGAPYIERDDGRGFAQASTSTAGTACRCAVRSRTSPTGSPRPAAMRSGACALRSRPARPARSSCSPGTARTPSRTAPSSTRSTRAWRLSSPSFAPTSRSTRPRARPSRPRSRT